MFWWPSSLAYFIPPAIVLAVAVAVLAYRPRQRPPASTLRMLGMPVAWAGVGALIGFGPVVAFLVVLTASSYVLGFLGDFATVAAIMYVALAVPMAAVSLAAARLGTPALSRLMRWMAVAGGGPMLAAWAFGMFALSDDEPTWLAALLGFSGASLAALIAAPRAHLAEPSRLPPPGVCPACGYDATGLDRCPECGVEMPEP